MKWSDVPVDRRPLLLDGFKRSSLDLNAVEFMKRIKIAESMQIPWRESNDVVEQIFISLTKLLSIEIQRKGILRRNKGRNDEVYGLLDFCVARIDHSMLSSIITK
jgi:hypothetical protein